MPTPPLVATVSSSLCDCLRDCRLDRGDGPAGAQVRLEPGGQIHLMVLVHSRLSPHVRGVRRDAVSTGLANVYGNKGGVGVSLFVHGVQLAFVNAHFQVRVFSSASRAVGPSQGSLFTLSRFASGLCTIL